MSSQSGPNRTAKSRAPASQDLLALDVDRRSGAPPLYRQVRDGVRAALLSGTLAAGMRLPPEREMATALGVNRTTVTRAYQELVADGIVEARGSAGTVVLPPDGATAPPPPDAPPWLLSLPALGEGSLGPDPTLLRDVAAAGSGLSLAAGTPGPDLLPVEELSACLDEALATWGRGALGYGAVEGFGPLRKVIADRLGEGIVGPGDGVLIVSGATQGLALVARAYHNPTGTVLSAGRRERLLALARRFGVPILEDDPYREASGTPASASVLILTRSMACRAVYRR
jgi:DNA-binding transcriptional MocR family regulator